MRFVVGIESSDGDPCDCCGTRCPRRRVVIFDDESCEHQKFGVVCAGMALNPSKGKQTVSKNLKDFQKSHDEWWQKINQENREALMRACREDHPTAGFMNPESPEFEPKWFPTKSWIDQRRGSDRFARCVEAHDVFLEHQKNFKLDVDI